MKYKELFDRVGYDYIVIVDDFGNKDSVLLEDLYQAFKDRLIKELSVFMMDSPVIDELRKKINYIK